MNVVMSTVATNCLTVAHYSKSPANAIVTYNWLSNFVISLLEIHNPALRCSPKKVVREREMMEDRLVRIGLIYLDPSMGGICGTSITRFHIRMFPDPITEALTFWKKVYHGTNDFQLKALCTSFGSPKLSTYCPRHFSKLLEDPSSINIPRGLSAQNLIKSEIKNALHRAPEIVKHEIIKEAVTYSSNFDEKFNLFLSTIQPCFPRFLSEFRASSYFGLTDSIIGLFQNSKTIRNFFQKSFRKEVDDAILRCELGSLNYLSKSIKRYGGTIWACSASKADQLREKSWNGKIVGMTIPHPAEMISEVRECSQGCELCHATTPFSIHVVAMVPYGIKEPDNVRGPFHPYLGSSTSETTSLIQSWEKDTDITFIRKAANMRRALNWFVKPDSNLGKMILANLQSLIGEHPGDAKDKGNRSGSALHRFSCSRVSPGGYIANAYTYGARMLISTDNFQALGEENYDFMYQSLILYAQQTIGEIHKESHLSGNYHLHISCNGCLGKIEEPTLDSNHTFNFPDKSISLLKWKPASVEWMTRVETLSIPVADWSALDLGTQSREIGVIHGVSFGILHTSYSDVEKLNNLFPIVLRFKLLGRQYLEGLMDGLYRAATVESAHRRSFLMGNFVEVLISSHYAKITGELSRDSSFISFLQAPRILNELNSVNHKIPSSYPISKSDLGNLFTNYMRDFKYKDWRNTSYTIDPIVWVFADFNAIKLSGLLIISNEMSKLMNAPKHKQFADKIRMFNEMFTAVRSGTHTGDLSRYVRYARSCPSEVRHAMSTLKGVEIEEIDHRDNMDFNDPTRTGIRRFDISYVTEKTSPPLFEVPRINNPLLAGLRLVQLASAGHYKAAIIMNELSNIVADMIAAGDGSGGVGAFLLRRFRR